ncbi:MAG TPA: helicase-related protein [Clostridia bacterium]|jgi:superfamily II DNA or RNA helicase|nr:helicase [Clostridiaceae bacterium]HOT70008.1 helicase-related protein [Clostridia bacterium]HQF99402.1 helicase-related protein [Clostridia bacterium]HQH66367.1 helicase-related protein [Clostridia bacterium]HQJ93117.1 helicase-related protein [Clostridia bacterium]
MANADEIKLLIEARNEYVKLIKQEMLGPGSEISIPDEEHELITSSPDIRYSIGILFPRNNMINADNDDSVRVEESVSEENEEVFEEDLNSEITNEATSYKGDSVNPADEENLDEEIGLAAQNMPSSMGITFFALGDSSEIKCKITFATYIRAELNDCRIPFSPQNPETYTVPEPLSNYLVYDVSERCLKFKDSKISRREIHNLKKQNLLKFDESNIYDLMYKLADQGQRGFVRVPHSLEVKLKFGNSDYIDKNKELDGTKAKLTALRKRISDDLYSITIMLVNDLEGKSNGLRCVFQPEIRVSSYDNSFTFRDYSGVAEFSALDSEEQSLELQYRNKKVYGTGLGTSINWNVDGNGNGELFSDFFPMLEVPQMDFELPPKYAVEKKTLSMRYLSDFCDSPKEEKIELLNIFADAYKKWIDELTEKLSVIDAEYNGRYNKIAETNITKCRISYNRIKKGIKALESSEMKWNAFALANRAMLMQRIHLKLQEVTSDIDRYPDDPEISDMLNKLDYGDNKDITADKYFWRPFQLAFLLMSINSVSEDASAERDIVDLIWFPTGGGKTEAYLGLTAFTIFYRRLAHPDSYAGTSVIMRYTLRLLAAQQFTRASTLICACEYIRRDSLRRNPRYKSYPLGEDDITIGLWIGGEHTPNKNKEAKDCLEKLIKSTADNIRENKDKYNKFQVLKCPWCGTKLVKDKNRINQRLDGQFGYRMRNGNYFELFCPQESCFFNQVGKLPIQIIDEELYKSPPTLLFGTVDKFAMLPWKKEIGSFFGLNNSNRSPELIIQDELHLISGPLGTMVGLYETAIDALCSSKGIKAKIVASTATIRRAAEQCSALYNREVAQFPQPGLDAEDSFFARELNINYDINQYGRLYIGLMPSGKTKAMMQVRSIAALLQKINVMDLPDSIKDKFWTLTVYFNSLKDLGKCSTLVDDDVKDFIKRTAYRLGTAKDARMIAGADELTSRVSTTELNETLDKLEKLEYSKENIENKRYASNVLLATNMISVGIDVARLNVMLLVGQPKLTSEYIQASSRIGRSNPGIAFILYDGSKSRDRSHYEQFKPYHESFYKYVEPTGATPFSNPARERALHAVVIALLRHTNTDLLPENGAANFSKEKYTDSIEKIRDYIINRDASIITRMNSGMTSDSVLISEEIDRIVDEWERMAESYGKDCFTYGEKYMIKSPKDGEARLMKVYNSGYYDAAFDTMTSMRNVDSLVKGNILIWEEK